MSPTQQEEKKIPKRCSNNDEESFFPFLSLSLRQFVLYRLTADESTGANLIGVLLVFIIFHDVKSCRREPRRSRCIFVTRSAWKISVSTCICKSNESLVLFPLSVFFFGSHAESLIGFPESEWVAIIMRAGVLFYRWGRSHRKCYYFKSQPVDIDPVQKVSGYTVQCGPNNWSKILMRYITKWKETLFSFLLFWIPVQGGCFWRIVLRIGCAELFGPSRRRVLLQANFARTR